MHNSWRSTLANILCTVPSIVISPWNINSLGPSDATWRQRTESTLAQAMACCLTAPNHYVNQCWLIINKFLRHPSEGITPRKSEETHQYNKIENYIFKIAFRSPRGQWVNLWIFKRWVFPAQIRPFSMQHYWLLGHKRNPFQLKQSPWLRVWIWNIEVVPMMYDPIYLSLGNS